MKIIQLNVSYKHKNIVPNEIFQIIKILKGNILTSIRILIKNLIDLEKIT